MMTAKFCKSFLIMAHVKHVMANTVLTQSVQVRLKSNSFPM